MLCKHRTDDRNIVLCRLRFHYRGFAKEKPESQPWQFQNECQEFLYLPKLNPNNAMDMRALFFVLSCGDVRAYTLTVDLNALMEGYLIFCVPFRCTRIIGVAADQLVCFFLVKEKSKPLSDDEAGRSVNVACLFHKIRSFFHSRFRRFPRVPQTWLVGIGAAFCAASARTRV